jgi:hypothetical protein
MKDFASMTKEELVALLEKIATEVQYTEDGGDYCLWLMEVLDVKWKDGQ